MNIENNILRHYLKNVYFISGTACGGKTTMSRLIAEKYGFTLYDMDAVYAEHRAMADPVHQPETCYHMTDHHQQWTRPVEEQARWCAESIREQTDMVLLDLVRLSADRIVVADVLFAPQYTREIIADDHMILLTADRSLIRESYFNRPEKRSFYEFVKAQPLADLYFENILQSLELTNDRGQELMRKTGFKMVERTENSTVQETLRIIEHHFNLL